jgi:enediyne biosynthesis protein E4
VKWILFGERNRAPNVVAGFSPRRRHSDIVETRAKARDYIAIVLILLAPLALSAAETFPKFVDVAAKVGITLMNICGGPAKDYIVEANGNGAAFFDYNNDNNMDVLIVNGSTLENYKKGGDQMVALYKNTGGTFVDVTREAGLTKRGWGMGACAGDYNNDGFTDIYVTAYGPGVLFRNNGNGTFTDVTREAAATNVHWGTNCAFGDYDRDGHLDLYVANYMTFDEKTVPKRGKDPKCKFLGIDVFCGPQGLQGEPDVLFHNNGNGTFTDVTKNAGIKDPNYYGFAVMFSDLDNDGWPDIYVANDGNPNLLFHNNKNGTFSEMGVLSGAGLNEAGRAQSGMGVAMGDYDGNGLFDIFVSNFAGDTNTLYQNMGKNLFSDVTSHAGLGEISLPYLGWGTGIEDFDNDGLPDIFVANGHVYPQVDTFDTGQHYAQRKELYRNVGGGKFKELGRDSSDLAIPKSSRGAAFGDFDNDGNIDVLVINMNDRPSLFRNEGGTQNHWITMRLKGTRSNRDAIGARVEILTGGKTQVAEVRSGGSYLSNNDVRIHFGLGSASRVERIRIRWPNGNTEELPGVSADQFISVTEK